TRRPAGPGLDGRRSMNPTNDPKLRSWVPVPADSHFPIQNLPLGVFRRKGEVHTGVAIGEQILDLSVLAREGSLLDEGEIGGEPVGNVLAPIPILCQPSLNEGDGISVLAAGPAVWSWLRGRVSQLLRADEPALRDDSGLRKLAFVRQDKVEMLLPVRV